MFFHYRLLVIAAATMIYVVSIGDAKSAIAGEAPARVCTLKGNWRDSAGYNFTFTTARTGIWGWQAGVSGYAGCPAPWNITLTARGALKFRAQFQDTNTDGCGQSFRVTMQFAANCNGATGHYENAVGGGGGPEVWTRVD